MKAERGIIEVDPRHTARRIRAAIQGNATRALVELITNADDSYTRLEEDGRPSEGIIEVVYHKSGRSCRFAVRDYAEGMSYAEVHDKFTRYGAETSGMKAGRKVRGYFGQGAKDALASMEDGILCTFRDGEFVVCKLFIEGNRAMYELEQSVPADGLLRARHGVQENGTVGYFTADPSRTGGVPRFDTVHRELANNFHLRGILTNRARKVFLVDQVSSERRRIRYEMPQGKETLSETFGIVYGRHGEIPVRMCVLRSTTGELTQNGDNRSGGLLLLDELNVVLGISLFRYDNEPLAARFFGEVQIGSFRTLLDDEEPVLREDRDGLELKHPFCQLLVAEIEKRLGELVNLEKTRRLHEEESRIDREEAGRFRTAFRILNEIAETEAPGVVNLGTGVGEPPEPPGGFALYPSSAQITVGKRYNLQLHVNTDVVAPGTSVRLESSSAKIRLITRDLVIPPPASGTTVVRHITIEGLEPNTEGVLRACADERVAESRVFVVPEKELLFDEGMVFQPETVTLHPNHPRTVYLLVYTKVVESGSDVPLVSDNPAIHVSRQSVCVNQADALRHIAKYPLEVWGDGEGQQGLITAECAGHTALLEVSVKSKQEPDDKRTKGMFDEPEYNFDPEPVQRTAYSRETGRVVIYANFPSVKLYLGENCQYRKALVAQVVVADLVAERCFYEIARRKAESSAVMLRPEGLHDRVQRDAFELSRKHGRRIHEALVDQNLLRQFGHLPCAP